MSCCEHGFPRLSLTIRPDHPSFLVGLLDYVLSPYRVVVGKFLLVDQHWHFCVKGSIRERPL